MINLIIVLLGALLIGIGTNVWVGCGVGLIGFSIMMWMGASLKNMHAANVKDIRILLTEIKSTQRNTKTILDEMRIK